MPSTQWPRFAAFVLLLISGAMIPQLALAQDPVGPEPAVDSLFDLDPFTVNLIFAFLLPTLVGLVTKASTSPAVKALLLAALSAVAGAVTVSQVDGTGVVTEATLKAAGLQFVTAVAVYFGLIKPSGVAAAAQRTLVKDAPPGP